ncbi:hypothetical protein EHS25_001701 [Saitozyma podzolica]|uniref:Uncharacterized protein n=1 Tax=Saitozyma podzolica TaxID=1890683 RepID=A0A427YF61_9TREE|nr:hypothetical protein EHS25_001701 [Saitozyma podzolica]
MDISIVSLAFQAWQGTSLGNSATEEDSAAEMIAKLIRKQLSIKRNEAQTSTGRPPLSSYCVLPRWDDGEGSERRSQVLENGTGGRGLRSAGQAALPRSADGDSPLL